MNSQRNEDGFNANGLIGFFVGFLSGGLIGAVVMLLLAPQSGKQARAKIQKRGKKLHNQASRSVEDAVTEAGDKAHEFTDSVNGSVQEEVVDLKQQTQGMINEGG